MQKSLIIFSLVLSCLYCISCGSGKDNDLKVSLTGADSNFLIPTTTRSCFGRVTDLATGTAQADDITAKYFQLQNFTINWAAIDAKLEVFSITVNLQAQQLTGQVEIHSIGGNELHALNGSLTPWSGELAAAPSTADSKGNLSPVLNPDGSQKLNDPFVATCPPTFGGIVVPAPLDVGEKTISGEVTIVGKKVYPDKTEEPVSLKTYITITNNYGLQ